MPPDLNTFSISYESSTSGELTGRLISASVKDELVPLRVISQTTGSIFFPSLVIYFPLDETTAWPFRNAPLFPHSIPSVSQLIGYFPFYAPVLQSRTLPPAFSGRVKSEIKSINSIVSGFSSPFA